MGTRGLVAMVRILAVYLLCTIVTDVPLLAPAVTAQPTIPARFDGFVYKNRPIGPDSVRIEAFFDPVCPDSRDAWPPLKRALSFYGDRLSLTVHPFPLPASVVNRMAMLATKAVGNSYESSVASGFMDLETDSLTRISFKYGCSTGVYGTPFFFVNGFQLPDAGSAIDYIGWRRIIDPLIKEQERDSDEELSSSF